MSETLEQLIEQRTHAEMLVAAMNVAINRRKAQTLVRCEDNIFGTGCSRAFAVGELEYIQTLGYVRPSGCTDGDYWVDSQAEWECPVCRHRNRLYDKPDVVALKCLFKSVREEKRRGR